MPERVQLSRKKGWRMPPNTVSVARPHKYGNPFVIGMSYGAAGPRNEWHRSITIGDRATAVAEYRRAIARGHPYFPYDFEERVRAELAGKNLACFCPLDQPCHADVLLALANPRQETDR